MPNQRHDPWCKKVPKTWAIKRKIKDCLSNHHHHPSSWWPAHVHATRRAECTWQLLSNSLSEREIHQKRRKITQKRETTAQERAKPTIFNNSSTSTDNSTDTTETTEDHGEERREEKRRGEERREEERRGEERRWSCVREEKGEKWWKSCTRKHKKTPWHREKVAFYMKRFQKIQRFPVKKTGLIVKQTPLPVFLNILSKKTAISGLIRLIFEANWETPSRTRTTSNHQLLRILFISKLTASRSLQFRMKRITLLVGYSTQ